MIGSLPKLIALLMVFLLVGSTFVGGIIYFIRWIMKRWGTIEGTIIHNSLQDYIQEHSCSVIRIQLEDLPLRDY